MASGFRRGVCCFCEGRLVKKAVATGADHFVDGVLGNRPGLTKAPAAARNDATGPGGVIEGGYLRAAQAYMLISMPTGTSTIFGAFQAIHPSQVFGANTLTDSKLRPPRKERKRALRFRSVTISLRR
jgi:hypothetical protein